ncbi:AraC-like ligand binding domain-containing protein [Chitinophaga sp. YR627]|uniref:AraC family transcriptional regulator n=1 Tax=Chitinophaga sp. YR627 TaxID=1881041 RepID=UPI0008E3B7AF|nr:AraC family transcriptional regulator [Chitinophaga sp. YR627]SFN18358.1 AraC-like ligand binding domain-containing protein [Chitinophaga sp. YR627]
MAIISQLQDFPMRTPVTRDYFQNWNIRVVNSESIACENYISPNRRDFYKILFIKEGSGLFSLGVNNYRINGLTILFLHPNEIISWRSLSSSLVGHYCLFKKRYVEAHPMLKYAMEKHKLFADTSRSVISLQESPAETINDLFLRMHEYVNVGGSLAEEALQAYLQLLIVESVKTAEFPKPDGVSEDYRHIHHFFQLLEIEASNINQQTPISIKTAKEFADRLALSPNYLNAMLKKHTGQNISTHIKNRLLEESKALLLQTDWTLNDIGTSIGFAEQPNFTQFFKKNIGITPSEFRKSYAFMA